MAQRRSLIETRQTQPDPTIPTSDLGDLSVAYVLFIFPVLSETVVVNELLTLRSLRARVKILSWATPEGKHFYTVTDRQHAFTTSLMPFVSYIEGARFDRAEVVAANARLLLRRGAQSYARAYWLARDYQMVGDRRSFARFAVWADQLLRNGVQHLHAHFATEATAVAHTLSVLSGLPFSFTAHAHDIYRTPQRLGEKMRAASFVTTVCEANRQYMLRKYAGVDPEKVHVIRPGVDVTQFSPRPRRERARFRIVSIGRLVKTKGYVDLVAACRLLAQRGLDFDCQIVGEGHDRPEVEAAIVAQQMTERVHLLGAMPRDQILPILDGSDVFVLPCFVDPETNDRDGMPLVLAEAMAKGLPVVSTPVSGIPELVRSGAGFIVPERDVVALADRIEQIYRMSDEQRDALGSAGRQIVAAEFNLTTETEKLAGLIRRSAGQPGA